jgi:hypothetical protein
MRTDKQYYIRAARRVNRIPKLKRAWEHVTGWIAVLFCLAILVSPITGCIIAACNERPQNTGGMMVIVETHPDGHVTYNGKSSWSPWPWMN